MAKSFDIEQAKEHLSRLVDQAASGEEIVITKAGKPIARLVSLDSGAVKEVPRRTLGLFDGKYKVPDDFDDPLPDDLLALFYDAPLFPDERKKPVD